MNGNSYVEMVWGELFEDVGSLVRAARTRAQRIHTVLLLLSPNSLDFFMSASTYCTSTLTEYLVSSKLPVTAQGISISSPVDELVHVLTSPLLYRAWLKSLAVPSHSSS